MKCDIILNGKTKACQHQVELACPGGERGGAGRLQFVLDGEAGEADWAELADGIYSLVIGGRSYEVGLAARPNIPASGADDYDVTLGTRPFRLQVLDPRRRRGSGAMISDEAPQEIRAPMPGKIVRVLVAENQKVGAHEGLLVMEAMKMQNEIRAPRSGQVEKIFVTEGTGVETGAKLLRLA